MSLNAEGAGNAERPLRSWKKNQKAFKFSADIADWVRLGDQGDSEDRGADDPIAVKDPPMASDLAHLLQTCSLLFVSVMATGCATLAPDFEGLLTGFVGSEPESIAEPLPPNIPRATVVMVASGEQPVAVQYPLHEDAFIQGVLEKTGLGDRFRRMDIELYRQTPTGTHRLEIKYDRNEHQVPPMYDYALRPGDRLVVKEDTSNTLDDMLEAISLPFGR